MTGCRAIKQAQSLLGVNPANPLGARLHRDAA